MSSRKRNVVPGTQALRPGEGHIVPTRLEQRLSVTGETDAFLEFQIGNAPVPQRKYTADFVGLVRDLNRGKLLFGSKRVDGKGLRSLLVVQMSKRAIAHMLYTIERVKDPTYEEIVATLGIQIEPVQPVKEEPSQTVPLSANVVLAAMSGEECCVDFYEASPFAFRSAQRGGEMAVDPIVRVNVPSGAFVGLIRALKEQFPDAKEDAENHLPEE